MSFGKDGWTKTTWGPPNNLDYDVLRTNSLKWPYQIVISYTIPTDSAHWLLVITLTVFAYSVAASIPLSPSPRSLFPQLPVYYWFMCS